MIYMKIMAQIPNLHLSRLAHFSGLGVLSLLVGCANVFPPCNARTSPPAIELSGAWILERWSLAPNSKGEVRPRPLPTGKDTQAIAIQFDARTNAVSGFSGCNRLDRKSVV